MHITRFGFAMAATKLDKATRFPFKKMKNLPKTTNRDLVRRLGHLLGPIILLMPFSMGGGFFVIGNILKKNHSVTNFLHWKRFFISKIRGIDKNSYVALRALLHVEMMLQR